MTSQELFSELINRGLLDHATAEKVLRDAELSGGVPEDTLYNRGLVDEREVAKAKSALLKVPYRDFEAGKIPDDVLSLVPFETARNYRVVPVRRDPAMLVVGMLRPDDEKAQDAVRFIAQRIRLSLGAYIVTPSFLQAVFRRYMPFESEIAEAVKSAGVGAEETDEFVSLEEKIEEREAAPVIRIVASLFEHAVFLRASDVHVEPQQARLRIRFRIDGDLKEMVSLPRSLVQPIVSRVKVLARLKLDETRVPQDGRFRTVIQGRSIDFRVATFPTPGGEKAVARVLDPSIGVKDIDSLGFSAYNRDLLLKALQRPYGMILASGPTGSGKSTTLNALLRRLNTEAVNIVTLEDPVEYFVEGVSQSQVRPEIGYTFASGLRQILRQDPDVVMVGEIRDKETAGLAVNAALTGHLMLSTIHTNNAVGVIPRLIDLGVPPFLLSSALNCMLAQRLLPRICEACTVKTGPPPAVATLIRENVLSLPSPFKEEIEKRFPLPYTVFRAEPNAACAVCKGKGISGRLAIHEVFQMTREVGQIINQPFTDAVLWDEARRQGIVTLRQDGIIKALEGHLTMEEVIRETAE